MLLHLWARQPPRAVHRAGGRQRALVCDADAAGADDGPLAYSVDECAVDARLVGNLDAEAALHGAAGEPGMPGELTAAGS
mgnify:CR=1 FL=1